MLKRRIAVIGLIFIAALALLCGTLLVAVNTSAVHRALLSRINDVLPGTITVDRLHVALMQGRVECTGVTVADSTGKQLAGFKRLTVVVSLPPLLRRALVVETALLEHPWAALDIDSSGRLSLLNVFRSSMPSDSNVCQPDSTSLPFPVIVRNFRIAGGSISFVAQREQFSVQAHGLSIAADGETETRSGHVTMQLDSATVQQAVTQLHLNGIALTAHICGMDVDTLSLQLKTGSSMVKLDGRITSAVDSPVVNIAAVCGLALEDIRNLAGVKEKLNGTVELHINMRDRLANPCLDLGAVYHGGMVMGYPIDSLRCNASLADRVLTIPSFHMANGSGDVAITGSVDARTMFPGGFFGEPASAQTLEYNLAIAGKGIMLHTLVPGIAGVGGVTIALNGNGVYPDSLAATVGMSARIDALRLNAALPTLDAAVACTASVRHGTAFVHDLTGSMGDALFALTGKYRIPSGEMDVAVNAATPRLGTVLAFAGIDSVSGGMTLFTRIHGRPGNLDVVVDADADTVIFRNVRAGNVAIAVELGRDGTALVKQLDINNGKSHAQLRGTAKIVENGAVLPFTRMNFDGTLVAEKLSIEDFIDSVAGTVSIDAAIGGFADDLHGHVRLSAENLAAAGQRIARVGLDAELEGQRAIVQSLDITVAPGQQLTATGWASRNDSFDLAVSVPGIRLSTIAALDKIDSLDGVLSMELQARGTYARPDVRGVLAIKNIRIGATPLDDIGLHLELHDQLVDVRGKAGGNLRAGFNIDSRVFDAEFVLDNLPLAPYLAFIGKDFDGNLTARVNVAGDADSIIAMTGVLHVASLFLGYRQLPIIETHQLNASLENNRYTVPDFRFTLAGEGSLTGHAHGLLDGPHDAVLKGTVPLAVARHFAPDLGDIAGNVDINAFFKGTADNADLKADVRLRDVGMTVPGLTKRVHSLNGRILANPQSIRIETLQGNIDDGTFRVNGALQLDDLVPSNLNAAVTLKSLPLPVPDMLDMVLDGQLHISGSPDSTEVNGDLVLLDGLYYRDIVINPLEAVTERKRTAAPPVAEISAPYVRNMRFDVGGKSRSSLRVDNNLTRLTIAPDLHLTGTLASPRLSGRADVEQGTISYLRQTFTVDRGVVDFVNPYAIEPKVDIQGSVPVGDRVIRITLSGAPEDLAFTLAAYGKNGVVDEKLEDQDILSLLILGRTTAELQNELHKGDIVQSNQQMLAALVASTVGENIRKATGLDMFEIETGGETSGRIAVTVGKQLTRRFGTKYTVESDNGEILQRATAEYRLFQNLYFTGFQDTRGVYGGAIRFSGEKR